MYKLNLQDVAALIDARYQKERIFSGVSVDSRLHQPENLFFALSGCKTDGHHYLSEIAAKGAAAAVVKETYQGPDYGLDLLFVPDPLQALQSLCRKVLKKSKARIVSVTGSLGKTSTKDFLATVLNEKFKVSASPGNSNSQVGLPLAILNHSDGSEDILVLEMGMTHPGNISKLVEIAPPECAIITSIAYVHACNFDSLEQIAMAKAEILQHPDTRFAIINRDIENYSDIIKIGSCSKVSFSYENPLADYTAFQDDSGNLHINFHDETHGLGRFPIRGKHQQTNFLSVVACARYFGLSWEQIALGMSKLKLPFLRGQEIEKDGILFINDSYNAAELSVKAALENLPPPKNGGRKVAALSDMLELGIHSERSHRSIAAHALMFVDLMFCYGEESRHILNCWQEAGRPVQWFNQREDMVKALKMALKAGDVVLIKGSRGTQISKLLDDWETMPR